MDKFERLKNILVCPKCLGDLVFLADRCHCHTCNAEYKIKNSKFYFIDPPSRIDDLDKIKSKLKNFLGVLYYSVGVRILGPTYPFPFRKKVKAYLDPTRCIVIDVGCGNYTEGDSVIGVDMYDYNAVDVVCDASELPFRSGSIDGIATRSVLEHVSHLQGVIDEFTRCAKVGGYAFNLVPFLFPIHASPDDYQRLTPHGYSNLFSKWETLEKKSAMGPFTLLNLILLDFLSELLCLGNARVKAVLYLFFSLLLFPIKFLDYFFVQSNKFEAISPSFWYVSKKK